MTIQIKEMSDNDLNNFISQYELAAKILGFNDSNEMNDFLYHASEGMVRFGGSFSKYLGHALMSADMINIIKIIKTWRKNCDEHAALHRKFIQKRDHEQKLPSCIHGLLSHCEICDKDEK